MNELPADNEKPDLRIDYDDGATWPQLRGRLREIRAWAVSHDVADLLKILDRPGESGEA